MRGWVGLVGFVGPCLSLALYSSGDAVAEPCGSNLMVVLDRSCSMDQSPGAGETRTKWELTLLALEKLTTDYAGRINFGLIMFPDKTGMQCVQDGPIYLPVGPDHGPLVITTLQGVPPTGPCVTNIDTGIAQVLDDPAFAPTIEPIGPDGRRSFVLLITDGAQSDTCGGAPRDDVTVATIAELYAKGHPTYVLGFGGGAVDAAALDEFALAGGVPLPGTPAYYKANGGAELEEALSAIAGSLGGTDPEFSGCTGAPCPDDRCYGTFEQCISGTCVTVYPDAAPRPDAGPISGPGGGSDSAGETTTEGNQADGEIQGACACRVAARPARAGGAAAPPFLGLSLIGCLYLIFTSIVRARASGRFGKRTDRTPAS